MAKKPKPTPIIGLRALGGSVRTNPHGKATFLDVTFKCEFASDEQGLSGNNISLTRRDVLGVVQLAEYSYDTICKLLAVQGKTQQSE